jgi:hypothetical protein
MLVSGSNAKRFEKDARRPAKVQRGLQIDTPAILML